MLVPISVLPDPYGINIWNTREQLSKEMVSECIRKGLVKKLPLLEDEDHTNHLLHAQRVAFFVTENWSDPVDVDIQFTPEKEPYSWILDGTHRVAAAMYMLQDKVLCLYNEVLEQYLREMDVVN